MGAELLYADWQTDGRTDIKKLIVASRNFATAPKKASFSQMTAFKFPFPHKSRSSFSKFHSASFSFLQFYSMKQAPQYKNTQLHATTLLYLTSTCLAIFFSIFRKNILHISKLFENFILLWTVLVISVNKTKMQSQNLLQSSFNIVNSISRASSISAITLASFNFSRNW